MPASSGNDPADSRADFKLFMAGPYTAKDGTTNETIEKVRFRYGRGLNTFNDSVRCATCYSELQTATEGMDSKFAMANGIQGELNKANAARPQGKHDPSLGIRGSATRYLEIKAFRSMREAEHSAWRSHLKKDGSIDPVHRSPTDRGVSQ